MEQRIHVFRGGHRAVRVADEDLDFGYMGNGESEHFPAAGGGQALLRKMGGHTSAEARRPKSLQNLKHKFTTTESRKEGARGMSTQ